MPLQERVVAAKEVATAVATAVEGSAEVATEEALVEVVRVGVATVVEVTAATAATAKPGTAAMQHSIGHSQSPSSAATVRAPSSC